MIILAARSKSFHAEAKWSSSSREIVSLRRPPNHSLVASQRSTPREGCQPCNRRPVGEYGFSAKGAVVIQSLGHRPRDMFTAISLALKARFIRSSFPNSRFGTHLPTT